MNWYASLIALGVILALILFMKLEYIYLEWVTKKKHGLAYTVVGLALVVIICVGISA